MPGRNRKGPTGQWHQRGRGEGHCGGNRTVGSAIAGQHRGRHGNGSRGEGRGRCGHRHTFHATGLTGWQRAAAAESTIPESENSETAISAELSKLAELKEQTAELAQTLQQIQERLAELTEDAGESVTDSHST